MRVDKGTNVYYAINCVDSINVNASNLFGTGGFGSSMTYSIRPVIILGTNVKIDIEISGKDGKTPETAYIIK